MFSTRTSVDAFDLQIISTMTSFVRASGPAYSQPGAHEGLVRSIFTITFLMMDASSLEGPDEAGGLRDLHVHASFDLSYPIHVGLNANTS
jgi:hypothetical protein